MQTRFSAPGPAPAPSPVAAPGLWRPAAGLAALLVAEVLVLTYRFDSQALVDGGRWWGPLVGYARYLPQGLMAAAAAALVFAGRGLNAAAPGDQAVAGSPPRGAWP